MEYLVEMEVKFPESLTPEQVADFQERERDYSQKLQEGGELKAIYRVVGRYANVSIFDVESNQHLHDTLSGFPMYPYMDIRTTALCTHPNSIR